MGKNKLFKKYYSKLKNQFSEYDLELTMNTSNSEIVILDIEIFKFHNQFHTREHRKETSSLSYLKFGSAHPSYTFKGIIKSQLYRLRRLCSRKEDFDAAVLNLRERCLLSGYDEKMVDEILSKKDSLLRTLVPYSNRFNGDTIKIRWVILSNSRFENDIMSFVKKTNNVIQQHNIQFEIVKSTASSLGKLLFNNNDKDLGWAKTCGDICEWCSNWEGDTESIKSNVDGTIYNIDRSLGCMNAGIYAINAKCESQYTGKTSGPYKQRLSEHFLDTSGSAIHAHFKSCNVCTVKEDFEMQFLENAWKRGKYSLSEREYLWNKRIKGSINIQKTLKR
jgi:hypothetical protein